MKFRYEDLDVGKLILEWIDLVHGLASKFPSEERFELRSQVNRAATSVYLNLAEGSARNSPAEFARFITISLGSLVEVHAALRIAGRRKYITTFEWDAFQPRTEKIWFMLCRLRETQRVP